MEVAQRRAGLPFVRAAAQLGQVLLFAVLPLRSCPRCCTPRAATTSGISARSSCRRAGDHGRRLAVPASLSDLAPTRTTSIRRSRRCSWRPHLAPAGVRRGHASSRSRSPRRRSRCGCCACATGAATGSSTSGPRCWGSLARHALALAGARGRRGLALAPLVGRARRHHRGRGGRQALPVADAGGSRLAVAGGRLSCRFWPRALRCSRPGR